MDQRFQQFKQYIIQIAQNPDFVHHSWYVQYHLDIVQDIAMQLCDIYTDADVDIVFLLVRLHDYGKMLDFEHQHTKTLSAGQEILAKFGFEQDLIERAIDYIAIADTKQKNKIQNADIEVQILTSADAAAHLIGPFYYKYWHENPDKSTQQILQDQLHKIHTERQNKVVLPEVKQRFAKEYEVLLEHIGIYPDKFFQN